MANLNKKKGTAWETALVNDLKAHDFKALRLGLKGGNDDGDILIITPNADCTIQAKNVKKHEISLHLDELLGQMENGQHPFGAVVMKRRQRCIDDAYVVIDWRQFRDKWLPLLKSYQPSVE